MASKKRFTLIGMAPSGEACLVRDADGRVWVSSIYADTEEVAADDADRIIAEHDWMHVDRRFSSWDELEKYRTTHAVAPPPRFPDFADYDADEVRDALEETRTATSADARGEALMLVADILAHSPIVRTDDGLYAEVVARLSELTGRPRTSAPISPELADAMTRFALAA